jgi:hypothetical protein
VAQAERATPTLSFLTILVIEATSVQAVRMAHSRLLGAPMSETIGATPSGLARVKILALRRPKMLLRDTRRDHRKMGATWLRTAQAAPVGGGRMARRMLINLKIFRHHLRHISPLLSMCRGSKIAMALLLALPGVEGRRILPAPTCHQRQRRRWH